MKIYKKQLKLERKMMTLPEFLCIGAQKAGTSWLYEQLRTHPDIWMPPMKELHYFDYLFCADTQKWGKWHLDVNISKITRRYVENNNRLDMDYVYYLAQLARDDVFSENWYRRAFRRPAAEGKVLGDITPEYSTIGPEGISYVKRLIPDVKIIYIIRNPVDRALSHLRMNFERHPHDCSVSAWVNAASDPLLRQRGAYSEYVPDWQDAFSSRQLLFIPYKKIQLEPEKLLGEIGNFLSVADYEYEYAKKKVHATKKVDIPKKAIEVLSAQVALDEKFIKTEFGDKFFNMC